MISIVIPTYEQQGQGAKYLTELLNSISVQTLVPEVIVSDNATDGSIKHVCDNYPFVKYYFNPVRGASENINNAISFATHDKIKIMCQDDVMATKDCVKLFSDALDKAGWVISNSHHINERSVYTGRRHTKYIHGHFADNTVGMPSVIGFRKCNVRFMPELKTICDMFFYYQLFEQYGQPGVINQFTISCRFHNASLSRNQPSFHQKDFYHLIRTGLVPGALPKVVVAVVVYDRPENMKRWVHCWDQCETQGAELVFIHNDNHEDYTGYSGGHRYIKRQNIGYDIGALQDVCARKISLEYDYLLWCTDDTVPMSKDFIAQYIDGFSKRVGIVCMHLSTEINPHVRTTGFCLHRSVAERLLFPAKPVTTKEHCWQFEHRAALTLMKQIILKGLKIIQIAPLYKSPLYDMNYWRRNDNAKKLRHLLDCQDEHEKLFYGLQTAHKLQGMQPQLNAVS